MFFPWTLFFVNLILTIVRFLLLGTIGAALAIYSRLRGEHANSIRWVRQGGYLEMLGFLVNTRQDITKQAKATLLLTILATLSATIVGRGAVRYVEPASRQANPSVTVVNAKQYVPLSDQLTLAGWQRSIRDPTTIVDTITNMINDTSNIPGAVAGRTYTPRLSNYEVECDIWDVWVLSTLATSRLPSGGCGHALLLITGPNLDITKSRITKRSAGRWSISTPAQDIIPYMELSVFTSVKYNNLSCSITDYGLGNGAPNLTGITSLPKTSISKCVFPSGQILSMAVSTIRFMTSTVSLFNTASRAIVDDYDDLFQAMDVSVNNITSGKSGVLFNEVNVRNSSIDILSCLPSPTSASNPGAKSSVGNYSLACLYVVMNTVLPMQQEIDPLISSALGESLPTPPTNSIAMGISYLSALDQANPAQFSLVGIKYATAAAAQYFASLGQNFLTNWDQGQVAIVYDTTDVEYGLEIPLWLIICIPVIGVGCAIFLGSTEYLLDGWYTYSLYKTIAMPMRARLNSFAPMLMRSKVNPVEFDDIPVIPTNLAIVRGTHDKTNTSSPR